MNIKLITSRVTAILKKLPEITIPVKIEEIAKMRGIVILPYPLGDDVSGLLAIKDGLATIGYNQNEPMVRRRFTIAHELGHYELHRDQSNLFIDKEFIYRSERSGDTPVNQIMEKEANAFASAILMPTDILRKTIQRMELNFSDGDSLKELARMFEVSTTAMSIRIAGLGLF